MDPEMHETIHHRGMKCNVTLVAAYALFCMSFFFLSSSLAVGEERAFASLYPDGSESGRWSIQITTICNPLKQDLLLQTAACSYDR